MVLQLNRAFEMKTKHIGTEEKCCEKLTLSDTKKLKNGYCARP